MTVKPFPINIGFEKVSCEHKLYQLIPNTTINSIHCSDELLNAFHQINTSLAKRLNRKGMFYTYYEKDTITYEIYLSKEQIKFTLAIPTRYDTFITNKINSSWKNVGINECEDYLHVFENDETLMCDMSLEKHYFLSLLTDKRQNAPLDSILETTNALVDDDKLMFQLLLEPINNYWHYFADEKYEQYKKGKDVTGNTNFWKKAYMFLYDGLIKDIIYIIETVVESFLGEEHKDEEKKRERFSMYREREIKKDKTAYDGFNTKIRLFSYSKDEIRRKENLNGLIVAMRNLDGDNSLKAGDRKRVIKIKRECGTMSFLFPNNILNTKEVQQMVSLPNKELQRDYKQLKAIHSKQTDMPKIAFDGNGIKMGLANVNGVEVPIRFSNKEDDIAQSKALVCNQGGGKTTLMQNYIYEAYQKGDPIIVLDYVQGCEMTNEIKEFIDEDKLVILNMDDYTNGNIIGGLGYNEINYLLKSDNSKDRIKGAGMVATQVKELLDSIRMGGTEELSSQMTKYLASACRVVFSTGDATIMDVYYCLEDVETRDRYIELALSSGTYHEDHVDIKNLKYLTNKGETRYQDVKGVLSRFAGLQSLDLRLVELFSNKIDESIDINKYIDESKVVFIQIPQQEFTDDVTRDILTTFFATKIWLTCQTRKQHKLTHLLFDEIKMIPNTSEFLSRYITQFRRHRLSTLFACHNLQQFRHALTDINSSGMNLFIMSGVKRDAIKCIEDDLSNFEWDDIKGLKPRHAVVLTTYDNAKYEFTVHLQDKFFKRKDFKPTSICIK